MIIKANAVLKIRVPETDAFEGQTPEQIIEAMKSLMNGEIAALVEKDTGLHISLQVRLEDLRSSQ